MTKENKTILLYVLGGWILVSLPMYLILDFTIQFSDSWASPVFFGIFAFVISTGVFIGAAEKKLREDKEDKLLDRKLKNDKD